MVLPLFGINFGRGSCSYWPSWAVWSSFFRLRLLIILIMCTFAVDIAVHGLVTCRFPSRGRGLKRNY